MLPKKVVTLQLEGDKTPSAHKIFINNVIIFMNFTLLITVMLTAVTLVVAAYVIAKLIGPRSYNPVKGEPFECGIPTRGSSWLPSHIGYYLFAILFLMFDIETMLLYPWAVVVKQYGSLALVSISFFLLVLVFGLAYAWRKGALEWK
jgi:NADH:ubiquinone oxidoreductase subunit 3 (subunit A)